MILPKAELHCHIEGAAPVRLALSQAAKYNVDIAAFVDENIYRWHDFTSFIQAYDTIAGLFRTEDDYAILAEHYLMDIARMGAIYSEVFVSPDHARSAGLSAEKYINGLSKGIQAAQDKTGIICRMIVVGVRHLGAQKVMDAAKFAADINHPLITGFGMAGDERYGQLQDYARAFDIARDAGLGITIHAGELVGAKSVRDSLDMIKPARIGHGVRAIEDPDLVQRLANDNIVLEICPNSNIALNVFPSIEEHPIKKLMDQGVLVTISSDDPPYFNTSLQDDYQIVQDGFNLNDAQMRQFTINSIQAAFIDDGTRQVLLGKV